MQHHLPDIVKSQVDLVSAVVCGARGATLWLRLRDAGGQIQVWLVTN